MDPSQPIPVLEVTDAVRPRLLAGAPRLLEICKEAYVEDGRAEAAGTARPPHVVEFVTGAAFVLDWLNAYIAQPTLILPAVQAFLPFLKKARASAHAFGSVEAADILDALERTYADLEQQLIRVHALDAADTSGQTVQ